MGGYGTLIYSLKYPELFAAAAPLSAAVYDDESMENKSENSWNETYAQLYGRDLKGKKQVD